MIDNRGADEMDEGWYRLGMAVVGIAGFWEGVMAIIFRLFTDKEPSVMSAANYLPAPWCYVVAGGIVVVAFAIVAALDSAHKKVLARKGSRENSQA
ncbi:hypothetical protein ACFWY9_13760 [Amycolatopsis sp. NPDC059027]|uniref:hypothetical protein n=1 Tax=unclassified Amycolatopsis TaxID=2618356 RepID=UPI00366C36D0